MQVCLRIGTEGAEGEQTELDEVGGRWRRRGADEEMKKERGKVIP